jgi:DNA-binding LytR/AlgR family response regulator
MKQDHGHYYALYAFGIVFIKVGRRLVAVKMLDIILLEAADKYVKVTTTEKVYLVLTTINQIMGTLCDKLFFRSHRSFIVNSYYINWIEGDLINLGTEKIVREVPLHKSYVAKLFDGEQ